MNELEKCAEILVECGYCESSNYLYLFKDMCSEINNPFADMLEGRKQADALENHFKSKHANNKYGCLWELSADEVDYPLTKDNYPDERLWRLNRIKWCIYN